MDGGAPMDVGHITMISIQDKAINQVINVIEPPTTANAEDKICSEIRILGTTAHMKIRILPLNRDYGLIGLN
jgi:hypothetical protein